MRYSVIYLTKKRSGDYARREEFVECEALRFGRGSENEVFLGDPRIAYESLVISHRPGGFFAEARGGGDFRLNGKTTRAANLKAGDKISLGPYEIEILPADENCDFRLSLELVLPLEDDLQSLQERSRISLAAAGGKRRWSWLLFLLVAIVFVALPIYAHFSRDTTFDAAVDPARNERSFIQKADVLWNSGELSKPHQFIGESCQACHVKAFEQTPDSACLSCHKGIQNHADAKKFPAATFTGVQCQDCHKEHNGPREVLLRDQQFCVSCHAGIEAAGSVVTIRNAADFATAHPQFRPTVLVNPEPRKFERVPLKQARENSSLKFPHKKHLDQQKGVKNPRTGKVVKMVCADCHVPEKNGPGMKPIEMEAQCEECHALSFTQGGVTRELPHAKPEEAFYRLVDFFTLETLKEQGATAAEGTVTRMMPGRGGAAEKTESPAEALNAAEKDARTIAAKLIGKGLCSTCHQTKFENDTFKVTPVLLTRNWLPKGRFDHKQHAQAQCVDCHAAVDSERAEDVLLPGIETCQACHGGESTSAELVPSTCVDCHNFHLPGRGAMGTPSPHPSGKGLRPLDEVLWKMNRLPPAQSPPGANN